MAIKKRKGESTTQISGPFSIADLPTAIFLEILLKLSTKSIVLCKCVCKTWHGFISDPQFAKSHLEQSKTFPLTRDHEGSRISRALYLLEPEDGCGFDVEYCWCKFHRCRCGRSRRIMEVKSKLTIPLRNAHNMLSYLDDDVNAVFSTKDCGKRKGCIKLKSQSYDHTYRNMSSCNGLLCLAEKSSNDRVVVCNPITDEFIYLPKSDEKSDMEFTVSLGFSPKNNQYKVVRMFYTGWLFLGSSCRMAEIHTVGTDSWRNVDISAFKLKYLHSPTYFKGALHWFCSDNIKYSHYIASLDLDEEQFRSHSVPSTLCLKRTTNYYLAMGVLGGCLCVYDDFSNPNEHIDIWAMKEYGVGESWTKLFSIDISTKPKTYETYYRRYLPISCLNNGALLMFDNQRCGLIYYDQVGGLKIKHVKSRAIRSKFEAIAYTPSFISLKDITSNVEVLNVNSRYGKIKLWEEAFPVVLANFNRL